MIPLSRVSIDEQFRLAHCGPDVYQVISSHEGRVFVVKCSPPSGFDADASGTRSNMSPATQVELTGETDMPRNKNAKGRPAGPVLLRTLKLKTLQGKIIEFLLKTPSVNAAMDEFFMERHSLMTQLNIVARNTGIGYSVAGDVVTLTLPSGIVDPFELDF